MIKLDNLLIKEKEIFDLKTTFEVLDKDGETVLTGCKLY